MPIFEEISVIQIKEKCTKNQKYFLKINFSIFLKNPFQIFS